MSSFAVAQMAGVGVWWEWLSVLPLVVFALLLAFAVFAVVRYLFLPLVENERPGAGPDEAVAILRERFARGEIDEEEFERRVAALREHEDATRR